MHQSSGDPSEWPKSFPEIKEFDTLLRCGICYETMKTAMMLQQCSHNYCSLCIRKYMTFKTQCPTCRVSASDLDLRNNRVLDDLIKQFISVRSRLLQLVSDGRPRISSDASNDEKAKVVETSLKEDHVDRKESTLFTPRRHRMVLMQSSESDTTEDEFDLTYTPKSTRASVTRQPKTQTETVKMKETSRSRNNINNSCNVSEIRSPVTSKFTLKSPDFKRADCATPKTGTSNSTPSIATTSSLLSTSGSTLSDTPVSTINRVSCPVCMVSVPAKHINLHLDRCLNSDSIEPRQSTAPQKRKRLPKLVYNLLSDKELRKKLSEFKLSTQGDRQTLVKRHHQFTLLYNAECDSLNPKSVEDLVKEVQQSEKTKAELTFSPSVSRSNSLQINKGASSSEVESAQKHYAKQHKSQFDQLIAETKIRMKKLREAKKQNQQDPVQETEAADDITLDKQDSNIKVKDKEIQGPALPGLKIIKENREQNNAGTSKAICENELKQSLLSNAMDDHVSDKLSREIQGQDVPQSKVSDESLQLTDKDTSAKNVHEKSLGEQMSTKESDENRETSSCVPPEPLINMPSASSSVPVLSDDSTQDLLGSDDIENSGSLISHESGNSLSSQRSRSGSDAASESLAWLSQRCPKGNSESNTRDAFDSARGSPNFDLLGIEGVSFEGVLNTNGSKKPEAFLNKDDNVVNSPESASVKSDGENVTSPVFNSKCLQNKDDKFAKTCPGGFKIEGDNFEECTIDYSVKLFSEDNLVPGMRPDVLNDEQVMRECKVSPEKFVRKRKLRSRSPKEQIVDIPKKKSKQDLIDAKDNEKVFDGQGVCTRRQLRTRKK